MEDSKYLSIEQLSRKTGYTHWQIRHWILRRKENGLEVSCIQLRNKMFINEFLFQEWLKKNPQNFSTRKCKFKRRYYKKSYTAQEKKEPRVRNDDSRVCKVVKRQNRSGLFRRVFECISRLLKT